MKAHQKTNKKGSVKVSSKKKLDKAKTTKKDNAAPARGSKKAKDKVIAGNVIYGN